MNEPKIAIFSHITPDGDAIGSMLGTYHLVRENLGGGGIEVLMILDDPVPETYRFLAGADKIIRTADVASDYVPDIAIALDTGTVDRLGAAAAIFAAAPRKIKIDHHDSSPLYGDKNFIYNTRSSAAEIITEIATRLKWRISKDAANALHTGIVTDSGRFSYVKTSPQTFNSAAKLAAAGAELEQINSEINLQSLKAFKAVSVISSRAKFEYGGRLSYCYATHADYENFDITYEEIKGSALMHSIRNIRGVAVSIVFYDLPGNKIYVSMRGRGIPVRPVAVALGHGGHDFAAAAVLKDVRSPDAAIAKVVEMFRERLQ